MLEVPQCHFHQQQHAARIVCAWAGATADAGACSALPCPTTIWYCHADDVQPLSNCEAGQGWSWASCERKQRASSCENRSSCMPAPPPTQRPWGQVVQDPPWLCHTPQNSLQGHHRSHHLVEQLPSRLIHQLWPLPMLAMSRASTHSELVGGLSQSTAICAQHQGTALLHWSDA